MLDDDNSTTETPETQASATRSTRRRAAGRPAGPPAAISTDIFAAPAEPTKATRSRSRKPAEAGGEPETDTGAADAPKGPTARTSEVETSDTPKRPRRRTQTPKDTEAAPAAVPAAEESASPEESASAEAPARPARKRASSRKPAKKTETEASSDANEDEDSTATGGPASAVTSSPGAVPMFQAPETTVLPPRPASEDADSDDERGGSDDRGDSSEEGQGGAKRRRRSRGGRRRNKSDDAGSSEENADSSGEEGSSGDSGDGSGDGSGSTRRRRRRARSGERASASPDDPEDTVVKVREGRSPEDEITGVTGSTRLEAKKQRRREGREAGRRRAPIVSEAEFLARRESVERQMVVRQSPDSSKDNAYTQIAVLEDSVLVEHYVARESQISIIGNVYLGKVQNVLPSMEAAFVDIGAGRNAVIYAGEVDWSGVQNGKARKIEEALSPGQTVLVQVTKDPIGQKGARLTSQISLPGRFLVYVPGGQSNGISRKLPDTERARLKSLLKEVLPEDAGVIVRTAAEGATEDQLTRDVTALKARWEDIESKVEQTSSAKGGAPQLLYAEPDLVIKVVRDLFNEDFASLVVEGPDAWDNISGYIQHVAPDLAERLSEWRPSEHDGRGAFEELRLDEQIHKALERKVWLPSGGSLVIDRTEAMTVVDVNTGKFTGSGGNLEETVTKNNLEAAEEIVRQLRLRDIGGIIVIDFIDMVLESNRDLVLRRLVECLGRDRTRHQVAEVTSLGLVQMTRKRIGTGLLESFSADCDHCKGRGVVITAEPVEPKKDDGGRRGRKRGGRGGDGGGNGGNGGQGRNADSGKGSNSQDSSADRSSGSRGKKDSPASSEGKAAGSDSGDTSGPADQDSTPKDVSAQEPTSDGSAADQQPAASQEGASGSADSTSVVEQDKPATTPRQRGRRKASRPAAAAGAPASAAGGDEGETKDQTADEAPAEPTDVGTEKADDQLGTSPVLTDVPDAP